jgi:hypothetical protein
MAEVPGRYRGEFSAQFAHPLLVRCAIDYRPTAGGGPTFQHEFVLTPDGILATLRSRDAGEFGVTWPLLVDDGAPLRSRVEGKIATTEYPGGEHQQCFLALKPGGAPGGDGEPVRGSYGWLRPLRSGATGGVNRTFVYPRSAGDPDVGAVAASFRLTEGGFESALGSVAGTLYVGRTSAGGEGERIDVDGDGQADAIFEARCRFVLQLRGGKITAVEADRATGVVVGGRRVRLQPYVPTAVGG